MKRYKTLLIFMIFTILLFVFAVIAQNNIRSNWILEQENEALWLKHDIDMTTDEIISSLQSLYYYVQVNKETGFTQEEFAEYASLVTNEAERIINVSVAVDGIQSHIYPLVGNEDVIGYNLMTDTRESVRDAINRALLTKEPQISGPYPARQDPSSNIIVFRYPVFNDDESFYGLVNMVIYTDNLFINHSEVMSSKIYDFEIIDNNDTLLFGQIDNYDSAKELSSTVFDWTIRFTEKESYTREQVFLVYLLNISFLSSLLVISYLIYLYSKDNTLLNKSIDELIYYDELTKLPNRRLLEINYQSEKMPSAIGFADLDNFKYINDMYGHKAGDNALVEVSKKMSEIIGKDNIFRWGGDEFVFLFFDDDVEIIKKELDSIIEFFRNAITFDDYSFQLSISIGVVLHPSKEDKLEDVLKTADITMYNIKQQGKNDYKFYDESQSYHLLKLIRFDQITKTMDFCEDTVIHYQPRFSFETNEIVGLEALIRLKSENGPNLPHGFIDVAENNNTIVKLDYSVIRRVGIFQKRLGSLGLNIPVAINISRNTFDDKLLIYLKQLIKEEIINTDLIELEITESGSYVMNEERILLFNSLKDLGFKLMLDDFGKQYSSLDNLSKLPIDVIKIDYDFVSNSHKKQTQIVIKSISNLAKTMEVELIAEGVETIAQYNFLKEINCHYFQGFLYEKPIDEETLIEKYITNKKHNQI